MTTRTQLKGVLFASSLFSALAVTQLASAAHPLAPPVSEEAASVSTSPKAADSTVKGESPEIVVAPPVIKPPARLQLREPVVAPPMTTFQSPRNEIMVFGMRLPTLIAFGLGGISAGGAVATGLAAARGNDPTTCDSRCTEHGVRQKALLLTTGVLTGMAAAGVTIGFTLMFKAPKRPTRDAICPRFDLGVSDTKAVAKVGWVFSSF